MGIITLRIASPYDTECPAKKYYPLRVRRVHPMHHSLYRSRNKRRTKDGVEKDGPPLRSLGAVAILRRIPKFGGSCLPQSDEAGDSPAATPSIPSGVVRTPGFAPREIFVWRDDDVIALPSTAVPSKQVARCRPAGVKKAKRLEKSQSALSAIAAAINGKTVVKSTNYDSSVSSLFPTAGKKPSFCSSS